MEKFVLLSFNYHVTPSFKLGTLTGRSFILTEQPLDAFLFQCFLFCFVFELLTRLACLVTRGFNAKMFWKGRGKFMRRNSVIKTILNFPNNHRITKTILKLPSSPNNHRINFCDLTGVAGSFKAVSKTNYLGWLDVSK